MVKKFNDFSISDNRSLGETKKTDPRGHLSLEKQNMLFLQKVEYPNGQDNPLQGKNQKDSHLSQQNKTLEEYGGNKSESVGAPKRESSGSYLDAIKSLSITDFTQLAKGTMDWIRQNGVESQLSGKGLTQLAKETVEWAWQNSVKSLSGKHFMQLMVIGLAVSGLPTVDAVKIHGKDGCSIDSQLIIDEHPSSYDDAHRIVEERFEKVFVKLVERYVQNPCDKKFEQIRITFDPNLLQKEGGLGRVDQREPTHLFLHPIESDHVKWGRTLRETTDHEFSHVAQDFQMPLELPDDIAERFGYDAILWFGEARADYNLYIYGEENDTKGWLHPPHLRYNHHYSQIGPENIAPNFMLWLDKKFPGFVDKGSQMAQEKYITWKDLEKLTDGRRLGSLLGSLLGWSPWGESLWREYKKIDFTAEMSPFIAEQRQKYSGDDQHLNASSILVGSAVMGMGIGLERARRARDPERKELGVIRELQKRIENGDLHNLTKDELRQFKNLLDNRKEKDNKRSTELRTKGNQISQKEKKELAEIEARKMLRGLL